MKTLRTLTRGGKNPKNYTKKEILEKIKKMREKMKKYIRKSKKLERKMDRLENHCITMKKKEKIQQKDKEHNGSSYMDTPPAIQEPTLNHSEAHLSEEEEENAYNADENENEQDDQEEEESSVIELND